MERGESLREAACLGNLQSVQKLLGSGANINSRNSMNGWTPLHWACKRGHNTIVCHLLQNGADVNLKTLKGETPADVTTSPEILVLLGASVDDVLQKTDGGLPIIPHYLQYPPFPYGDVTVPDTTCNSEEQQTLTVTENSLKSTVSTTGRYHDGSDSKGLASGNLVVKLRVGGSGEQDFVEVEVPSLTYSALLKACCEELDISYSEVAKIRKLPNVLVRKDRDVQRMKEGQELEVVKVS